MNAVYTQALAAITERRALIVTLLSAGEWEVSVSTFDDYQFGICRDYRVGPLGLNCHGSRTHAQALVAAVNAFERDTDAIEATLERHYPSLTDTGNTYCDGPDQYPTWPCPDAQAALTALGVGQ